MKVFGNEFLLYNIILVKVLKKEIRFFGKKMLTEQDDSVIISFVAAKTADE